MTELNETEKIWKLVKRASDNGWSGSTTLNDVRPYPLTGDYFLDFSWSHDSGKGPDFSMSATMLLFTKDFAEALWGSERVDKAFSEPTLKGIRFNGSNFQFHLVQMALSDFPIDYAYESLDLVRGL